jgi:hypothetical protein
VKRGADVKDQVSRLRRGFQEMRFCFEGKDLEALKQRLLSTF